MTPDPWDDWTDDAYGRRAARLLKVVGGLAVFGLLMALLFPFEAHGQTAPACAVTPPCEPTTTRDRTVCGAELRGNTAAGEWSTFWWRDAANSRWCSYSWAGLYKNSPSPRQIMAILDAVKLNPGPAAILTAIEQYKVTPPAGSADEYEYRNLHYQACLARVASPPASGLGAPTPPCAAPMPPTALSPYVVTASTAATRPAYAVVNGKRSITATGTAVPGQPCDCEALQIVEFNVARYCASPSITGINGPAVTACSARK